jgi:hypothetical protein
MLRRLPLTALLALLAVALPAAAEGDPSMLGIPVGPDVQDCLTPDLECPATAAESFATSSLDAAEGVACQAWELNTPDSSQPVWDAVILDPDGCIRSFLRRTLGWPPIESEVQFASYTHDLPL